MLQKMIEVCFDMALPKAQRYDPRLGVIKMIAHRGAHCRSKGIIENSFEAFQSALSLGCDGIEFDLRWSQDDVPFVLHDSNPKRVFNELDFELSQTSASRVRETQKILTLEEVVEKFAHKLHLMIELKTPLSRRQGNILLENLKHLEPKKDFHLLSLKQSIFSSVTILPPEAFLPVVEYRLTPWLNWIKQNRCAGLTGHYALLTKPLIHRLHADQQVVGTGMINSPSVLLREQARGVDWAFIDQAELLMNFVKSTDNQAKS